MYINETVISLFQMAQLIYKASIFIIILIFISNFIFSAFIIDSNPAHSFNINAFRPIYSYRADTAIFHENNTLACPPF